MLGGAGQRIVFSDRPAISGRSRAIGPAVRMITALLVFAAEPAAATQDAWPALFDVVGVAADDVLNVRAEPTAAAQVIGTIAPDATGVEVIAPDPRQTWGQVNMGEGPGWVSLAFLRRKPGQWLGAIPAIRQCFGTEPFWSLSLGDKGAVSFATPEGEPIGGVVSDRVGSESRRDRYALTGMLDGPAEAGSFGLHFALASCGDGMSSRVYGIEGDLVIDGAQGPRMLSGCCSLVDR